MNAAPMLWTELLRLGVEAGLKILEAQAPTYAAEPRDGLEPPEVLNAAVGPWPESEDSRAEPAREVAAYGPIRTGRGRLRRPADFASKPERRAAFSPPFESLCAQLRSSPPARASDARSSKRAAERAQPSTTFGASTKRT
jgi:hypothetical protein